MTSHHPETIAAQMKGKVYGTLEVLALERDHSHIRAICRCTRCGALRTVDSFRLRSAGAKCQCESPVVKGQKGGKWA